MARSLSTPWKIMNSFVILAMLVALIAFLIRYLIPQFPADGIDQQLVSSRLILLQHAAVFAIALLGLGVAVRETTAAKKMRVAVLSLAVLGAYVLAHYQGSHGAAGATEVGGSSPQYEFSTDWITRHEALWRHTLGDFRNQPNIHALEIGSFEGRSAIWFLEHILTHPTASITCIDIWSGTYEHVHNFEAIFDRNVAAYQEPNKVIKLKGKSEDLLGGLRPESFDFIYIDGSHDSRDVLVDAVMSFRLLKPGGYLIFDDYERWNFKMRLAPHRTAKRGIDAFIDIFAPYLHVQHRQTQVVLRKREGPAALDVFPRLRRFLIAVQHLLGRPAVES